MYEYWSIEACFITEEITTIEEEAFINIGGVFFSPCDAVMPDHFGKATVGSAGVYCIYYQVYWTVYSLG